MSSYCNHRNMQSTARMDYCPECKYEYYYADVHSSDPDRRENKLVNAGKPNTPELRCICGQCGTTRLYCECDEFEEVWK